MMHKRHVEQGAQPFNTRLASAELRDALKAQVIAAVKKLKRDGVAPHLAVVLVGDNPASTIYVHTKGKMAQECGIEFTLHHLPADTSQAALHLFLEKLNHQDDVQGVLLQMPLPPHLDKLEALNTIAAAKDVDGLTDANHLALEHDKPSACHPCTPLGIMRLLQWAKVPVKGQNVVIIGRSRIVGKPLATMMNHANATVTLCHSHTADLKAHLKRADIVVAAAGAPDIVTGADLKQGAVVIDVGINSYTDAAGVRRLQGDCDYASCAEVARFITPVPGGVGPMTVMSLMTNMVDVTCRQHKQPMVKWHI